LLLTPIIGRQFLIGEPTRLSAPRRRGGHQHQATDQRRGEYPDPMNQGDSEEPRCSFCGATLRQRTLIAGPDVYICHECVKELAAIVHDIDPDSAA
jgi:hypothetical protein